MGLGRQTTVPSRSLTASTRRSVKVLAGSLKVGVIAPPWFAVPPVGYGGIETVVALLVDGLVEAGHEVTLVASGDSRTRGHQFRVFEEPPSSALGDVSIELGHVLAAYDALQDVDVIHDHSGMVGPAIGALGSDAVVVHTLHGPWTDASANVYRRLASELRLVAISHDQARRAPEGVRLAGVVHNGIDVGAHPFGADKEDFLLFVGRASREKGPEVALEVARRLGKPLVMAMKVNEAVEFDYHRDVVKPAMRGVDVELLTNADFATKVDLMQRASCLVFPIQWPEPFGLVMVEAMAAGTPVAAFAMGAAPEVIVHGQTGHLVPPGDIDGLCEAVLAASTIDPRACREHVERWFCARRMVEGYQRIYHAAIADRSARAAGARPTVVPSARSEAG